MKLQKIALRDLENLITYWYETELTDNDVLQFFAAPQNELLKQILAYTKTKTKKGLFKAIAKHVGNQLSEDVAFIAQSDPAATSKQLVKQNASNGLIATVYYRVAHTLDAIGKAFKLTNLSTKSFELTQFAATQTGIEIHPSAKIEPGFFIDHGQGIVIGQTAEVGKHCTIFNGVILGSRNVLNPKSTKRHPTLKNNVTVCAGAKILGDIVLGDNVFVSPNAVVIDSIEEDSDVLIVNQLQIKKRKSPHTAYLPSQQLIVYGVTPKFKNSICILGEGIYNPNVIVMQRGGKQILHQITYWDKNKIFLKFKSTTPFSKDEIKGIKLVVFSNSNKVVLLNNLAIEKVLTSLTD